MGRRMMLRVQPKGDVTDVERAYNYLEKSVERFLSTKNPTRDYTHREALLLREWARSRNLRNGFDE